MTIVFRSSVLLFLLVSCAESAGRVLSPAAQHIKVERCSPTTQATALGEIEGLGEDESSAVDDLRSEGAARGANFVRIDGFEKFCAERARYGGCARHSSKVRGYAFLVPPGGDAPREVKRVRILLGQSDVVEFDKNKNIIAVRQPSKTTRFMPGTATWSTDANESVVEGQLEATDPP